MDNPLTWGGAAREEKFLDPQHAKETAKQERAYFQNECEVPLNIGILAERLTYAENFVKMKSKFRENFKPLECDITNNNNPFYSRQPALWPVWREGHAIPCLPPTMKKGERKRMINNLILLLLFLSFG